MLHIIILLIKIKINYAKTIYVLKHNLTTFHSELIHIFDTKFPKFNFFFSKNHKYGANIINIVKKLTFELNTKNLGHWIALQKQL